MSQLNFIKQNQFCFIDEAYDHAMEVPSIKFCYADVNCHLKLKFSDKNQKDLFSHPLMICVILKTRKYSFAHDFLNKFSQQHYLKILREISLLAGMDMFVWVVYDVSCVARQASQVGEGCADNFQSINKGLLRFFIHFGFAYGWLAGSSILFGWMRLF